MTNTGETTAALARITDVGFFERLATAVLRQANPSYAALTHPGINAEGKTIKGPLDGVAFVPGANPPHLLAAHHTTEPRDRLRRKWLLGSESAAGSSRGSTDKLGDLVTTAAIVAAERERTPSLAATLILTTNQEPRESDVRDLHAAALKHDIAVDLWSRSRLAHFLDNNPQGQWLRRKYLGIEQERLSRELLQELSRASAEAHRPPDLPAAWIEHALDQAISSFAQGNIVFIAADSGLGKSVACHKRLVAHIAAGGIGVVLSHEIIAAAVNLDQAIEAAMRQLCPSLAPGCGIEARRFGTPQTPLLFIVEDINRSGQASLLAEKLARWSRVSPQIDAPSQNWQILCPVWPRILAALDEQTRKHIESLTVTGAPFSPREGREAVQRRAAMRGVSVSDMDAEALASALGHDPLLIALHEARDKPDAHRVISDFVDSSLSRIAGQRAEYTASDYRGAIRALGREMLVRRHIDPPWNVVAEWIGPDLGALPMLRHLVLDGRIMRLIGPAADERLAFRHDRVRDQLLTFAVADIVRSTERNLSVLSDPYFAEIIGAALAREAVEPHLIDEVAACNPLALFHALRLVDVQNTQLRAAVLAAIDRWLDAPATHTKANQHLRAHALAVLSEFEAPEILSLVERLGDRRGWSALRARFRNGDVSAGVTLCYSFDPALGSPWRDQQIEHAKSRFGDDLVRTLDEILRQAGLDQRTRIGALRLAGYLADHRVALAIEASWKVDAQVYHNLDEYLWAAAQCCGTDPERFLGPVCDAWAALPEKSGNDNHPRTRSGLAADGVRPGFQRHPPVHALGYFIFRAASDDLRWPITYMLHGVDHPDVQVFIAHQLAAMDRRSECTKSFNIFGHTIASRWNRDRGNSRAMSRESRLALLNLWQGQPADQYLRTAAFKIWVATEASGDLDILRQITPSDPLWSMALRQRIIRGDRETLPLLLENIRTRPDEYWWFQARRIWSEEMTATMEQEFVQRRERGPEAWSKCFDHDWILSELLMERPIEVAEPILLRHWDHFRFSPYFVQAALYFASPELCRLAKEAIDAAPDPTVMLEHIDSHFGIKVVGRTGITRREQVEAAIPYLHLLNKIPLLQFWEVCNERGWFDIRLRHFDALITEGRDAEYLHREATFAALDRMASKEDHWIDRWLEKFIETGITHHALIALLGEWLSSRKSIRALELVANALIQIGRRLDLSILKVEGLSPADAAREIVADATFAVQRRTLH
jgi:hypothetical protein